LATESYGISKSVCHRIHGKRQEEKQKQSFFLATKTTKGHENKSKKQKGAVIKSWLITLFVCFAFVLISCSFVAKNPVLIFPAFFRGFCG
jgi:hypothetical protein